MDEIIKQLKQHGIPINRDNYLDVAYMGNPPEKLSAEQLAELPEEIQTEAGATDDEY